MVTLETMRKIALSFPETSEQPHFDKTSFRVGKKIFATYDAKKNLACLMLSPINQSVFSAFDTSIISPVPNKWGKRGATFFNLAKIRLDLFTDALTTAYCNVAPYKLTENYKA
ncbi:MmcQ/YjbR family DNA-binding protein [Pedobacter sp. LMG 31464]|uniref:MmcQ/YjbR family DNA-binding protein n=1 Tax=Pedobacter planticolens TaxID=2679964 RepID=A0A923E2C9_9SPHI|nr:MmcQ/YjbR family DNA-binding protein [Pedobacter planticolens]MBB2146960.1 MmcQ/YjbR family DNA-binding protein [Pedobacter planticolens]